jgi:putative transposase
MPRFARIVFPGGIYHVISRFYNREFLVTDEEERSYYLGLLGAGMEKSDAILLSWCIMSSHIHLVLKAGEDPLERLMKGINSGFAGWLNLRKDRKGAVFADRYKSVLVEEEAYLFELIRYVHNNPVRAGVVRAARQSRWSSHRAYLGLEEKPEWLNTGYLLSMFAKYPKVARDKFERYVDEGKREKRRKDLNGEESSRAARRFQQAVGDGWRISGPVVGSDQFQAKVLEDICKIDEQAASMGGHLELPDPKQRPTLDELIAVTSAVMGLEPWEFEQQPKRRPCAMARQLIVWLWVRKFGGRQIDVARKLETSTAAVSKWYGRAVKKSVELEPILDDILSRIPSMVAGETPKTEVVYGFRHKS